MNLPVDGIKFGYLAFHKKFRKIKNDGSIKNGESEVKRIDDFVYGFSKLRDGSATQTGNMV